MTPHGKDESELTLADGTRSISLSGHIMATLGLGAMVLLGWVTYSFLDFLSQSENRLEVTLSRLEAKNDLISQQRIDRCHFVSEEATKTLAKVGESLDRNTAVLLEVERLLEKR